MPLTESTLQAALKQTLQGALKRKSSSTGPSPGAPTEDPPKTWTLAKMDAVSQSITYVPLPASVSSELVHEQSGVLLLGELPTEVASVLVPIPPPYFFFPTDLPSAVTGIAGTRAPHPSDEFFCDNVAHAVAKEVIDHLINFMEAQTSIACPQGVPHIINAGEFK